MPSFFGSSLLAKLPEVAGYRVVKGRPNGIVIHAQASRRLAGREMGIIHEAMALCLAGRLEYRLSGSMPSLRGPTNGTFRLVVDMVNGGG
jgi:hypothetical protein